MPTARHDSRSPSRSHSSRTLADSTPSSSSPASRPSSQGPTPHPFDAQAPSRGPSSSRALISRIAAPFAPRPRHITDLAIETADPHRVYAPGDSVRGSVNFTAHKSIRLTHLVVQIHGFVKVFKNATPPGEGIPAEASAGGSGIRGARTRGNGFAKIFEDEQVLCGAGTLGPGRYQVPFYVKFPAVALPSSLDFERGTISYVLSTVLTRPTTVAPTMAQERKIYLKECVDVAWMNTPKQRAVSLKPVSKRTPKGRTPSRLHERDRSGGPSQRDRSGGPSRRSVRPESVDGEEPRGGRSPSGSEQSTATGVSTGSGLRHVSTVGDGELGGDANSDETKVITASVDILRDGFLSGDVVPIRVTVKHVKPVKAMQGVIVTLYRRARIDPSALLEVVQDPHTGRDDYLPKSRTGLGGLTLFNSSNFSHNYRYDLDQSIEPMIVNPNTMQGEVKAAVRIPDDTFPSITCVPHGLISFTYHVEVVMDLNGKLSAGGGLLPRLSMTRATTNYELGERRGFSPYGNAGSQHIFDTVPIRRLDSIAHCTFDIVVGTTDSRRKIIKKTADPWLDAQRQFELEERSPSESWSLGEDGAHLSFDPLSLSGDDAGDSLPWPGSSTVPPPEPEEAVDEKTRLRRDEERLLPSSPAAEGAASSSHDPHAPSAPQLEDLGGENGFDTVPRRYRHSQTTIRPPPPQLDESTSEKERLRRQENALLPSAPDEDFGDPSVTPGSSEAEASAPTAAHMGLEGASPEHQAMPAYAYAAASSSSPHPAEPSTAATDTSDDKHELERRRLFAEASQPNYDDNEVDGEPGAPELHSPTVPPGLAQGPHGDHQPGVGHHPRAAWEAVEGVEHLPEYQR